VRQQAARRLNGQARFAAAAGAGQGQKAHMLLGQQPMQLLDFRIAGRRSA
jgi:hypothetical protein